MQSSLRHLIRHILTEGDRTTSAPRAKVDPSYETYGSSTISKDRLDADIRVDGISDLEGAYKVLSLLYENPELESGYGFPDPTYVNVKDPGYLGGFRTYHSDNTENLTNRGWAVFGVSKYSPVSDFIPKLFITEDMNEMIEKYKLFGHCFVMFIDENGYSQRYDFGPSDKCPPLDRDAAMDKIIAAIDESTDLTNKVYDTLFEYLYAAAPYNTKPLFILGVDISVENKRRILSVTLPLIFNDSIFGIVPDIIHLFVPGKVWGTEEAGIHPITTPLVPFTTGKKIVESLCSAVSVKPQLEGNYYKAAFSFDPRGKNEYVTLSVMVKDRLFKEYDVIKNSPEGSRTQAYAGVRCNNISAGIEYCKSIMNNKCKVPYAVPIPGIDFPGMTGAINCALFAANAINEAGGSFKFNLQPGNEGVVTPASLFSQIDAAADFSVGAPSI